jgi:hypothetical protein
VNDYSYQGIALNAPADPERISINLFIYNPSGSTIEFNYALFDFAGQTIRVGDQAVYLEGGPTTLDAFEFGKPRPAVALDAYTPTQGGMGDNNNGPYPCATIQGPTTPINCPASASLVLGATAPVRAVAYVTVGGTRPAGDPPRALSIPLQGATRTPRLRIPHAAWEDEPGTAGQSRRWPVLFLQNPDRVRGAAGCIAVTSEDGSVHLFPYSVGPLGTYAFEPGDELAGIPGLDGSVERFSIEVDNDPGGLDCGLSKSGTVVGLLLTFDGTEWDIGIGADEPHFSEVASPAGQVPTGPSVPGGRELGDPGLSGERRLR